MPAHKTSRMFRPIAAFLFKLLGWKVIDQRPAGLRQCIYVVAPHTSNWDFPLGILARSIGRLENARYLAKNVVAAGLADRCLIQVAYAIGVARPMNVTVYTEGTGVISDERIAAMVNEVFDLRPKGIIQMLDLLRPIYEKTAAYGHFGREEPEFSWERTDKAAALRAAAGL